MQDAAKLITMDVAAAITIDAPLDRTFRYFVDRIGDWLLGYPSRENLDLKLEPFAGGRIYRDLPNGASIWWATVQIYRPNERLDFAGPLFVTAPSLSHVHVEFGEDTNGASRVSVHHRTIGETPAHPELVETVWAWHLDEFGRLLSAAP